MKNIIDKLNQIPQETVDKVVTNILWVVAICLYLWVIYLV